MSPLEGRLLRAGAYPLGLSFALSTTTDPTWSSAATRGLNEWMRRPTSPGDGTHRRFGNIPFSACSSNFGENSPRFLTFTLLLCQYWERRSCPTPEWLRVWPPRPCVGQCVLQGLSGAHPHGKAGLALPPSALCSQPRGGGVPRSSVLTLALLNLTIYPAQPPFSSLSASIFSFLASVFTCEEKNTLTVTDETENGIEIPWIKEKKNHVVWSAINQNKGRVPKHWDSPDASATVSIEPPTFSRWNHFFWISTIQYITIHFLTQFSSDPFVYCVTIFRNLLSQCLGHRRRLWIHDDGSWPPPMPRLGEICHPHPPNCLHCLTSFKFTPTQPVFPNWALLSLTEAPSQQGEHKGAKSRQIPLLTVEGSNTMYFGGLCKN